MRRFRHPRSLVHAFFSWLFSKTKRACVCLRCGVINRYVKDPSTAQLVTSVEEDSVLKTFGKGKGASRKPQDQATAAKVQLGRGFRRKAAVAKIIALV